MKLFPFRQYTTTSQHFNTAKLTGLNYNGGDSNYQTISKDRSELALHVNQNQQNQQEPQIQQLQIQVQLQQQQHQQQQKQQITSPHQQQQHQGLLSPGLNFTGSGKL